MDECRHELVHHWPFLFVYVQCGSQTSYDTPALLSQLAGPCNVHEPPGNIIKAHQKLDLEGLQVLGHPTETCRIVGFHFPSVRVALPL